MVFLPDRAAVAREIAGARPSYAPIRDALDERGIQWLDPTDPLVGGDAEADLDTVFTQGGHYGSAANRRVAEWLRLAIDHRTRGAP